MVTDATKARRAAAKQLAADARLKAREAEAARKAELRHRRDLADEAAIAAAAEPPPPEAMLAMAHPIAMDIACHIDASAHLETFEAWVRDHRARMRWDAALTGAVAVLGRDHPLAKALGYIINRAKRDSVPWHTSSVARQRPLPEGDPIRDP